MMNALLKSITSSKRVVHLIMLMVIVIIVHLFYIAVVRPGAAEWATTTAEKVKEDPHYKAPRSIYAIIHEPEPEAAIILAIWALAMCAHQWHYVRRCQDLLKQDLLHVGPGQVIVPKVAREYERVLDAVTGDLADSVQVRALRAGLTRFEATKNVQDVSTTIHNVCESESVRLEAEISMIRFSAWCIPAIGFVGTVRGLGEALAQTGFALAANNPSAVTEGLGVSFNSTFVALTLSIFVMFALYELQLSHDHITLDAENYAEDNLVSLLHVDTHDSETIS